MNKTKAYDYEKAYQLWIEECVKREKSLGFFFKPGSKEHYYDIMNIVHHLEKENPRMLKRLISNFIDVSKYSLNKDFDVKSFAANMPKGSVVRWKDNEGHELFYVNNGQNPLTKEKRLLLVSNLISTSDFKFLKQTLIGKVLKKDVERVYKKMFFEEQARKKNRTLSPKQKEEKIALYSGFLRKKYSKEDLNKISNSFERKFKKLIREGGKDINPLKTGKMLYNSLSKGEQRDVFAVLGAYSGDGLKSLLTKWKDEALEKGRNLRRKSNDYELSR